MVECVNHSEIYHHFVDYTDLLHRRL